MNTKIYLQSRVFWTIPTSFIKTFSVGTFKMTGLEKMCGKNSENSWKFMIQKPSPANICKRKWKCNRVICDYSITFIVIFRLIVVGILIELTAVGFKIFFSSLYLNFISLESVRKKLLRYNWWDLVNGFPLYLLRMQIFNFSDTMYVHFQDHFSNSCYCKVPTKDILMYFSKVYFKFQTYSAE